MTADWPNLVPVLQGLAWAVAGATAANRYMPERATGDIDLVTLPIHFEAAEARLEAAGFSRLGRLAIGGSAWRAPDGRALDLIELRQPWANEALDVAAAATTEDLPVFTLPFLVLMKLEASRSIDLGDVSRILGLATDEQVDEARAVMQRYSPELLRDFESFLALGRLEMQQRPLDP